MIPGKEIPKGIATARGVRKSKLLGNTRPIYLARTWHNDCHEGPPDIAPFEDLGSAIEFRKRFRRGFVERWPDRAVWDDQQHEWTRPVPP